MHVPSRAKKPVTKFRVKLVAAALKALFEKFKRQTNLSKTFPLRKYIYLPYIQETDYKKSISHSIFTCWCWATTPKALRNLTRKEKYWEVSVIQYVSWQKNWMSGVTAPWNKIPFLLSVALHLLILGAVHCLVQNISINPPKLAVTIISAGETNIKELKKEETSRGNHHK